MHWFNKSTTNSHSLHSLLSTTKMTSKCMFKTLVELGVGSFRSRKNSVEFFYGNIDWQLLTSNFLKFLGHTRWGEKEETASPFRLFHSLHLEFESSSRPIRTCEKTLRHWKMYYYDNGHFAINIPICLISINALAITTTGFDQHRVGKPRELTPGNWGRNGYSQKSSSYSQCFLQLTIST